MVHRTSIAFAVMLALSAPADAAVISGTFTGTVTNGSFRSSNSVDLTGSSVTGSGSVSSLAGAAASPGGSASFAAYTLPGGSVGYAFTFALTGETFSYMAPPNNFFTGGIQLSDNNMMQSAELSEFVGDPHSDTYVTLTGPEGSLFTNVDDLASLHAGPGVTIASPVFVGAFLNGGAVVAITSATFVQPVPEPPAWTLLAAALPLALCVASSRRSTVL